MGEREVKGNQKREPEEEEARRVKGGRQGVRKNDAGVKKRTQRG